MKVMFGQFDYQEYVKLDFSLKNCFNIILMIWYLICITQTFHCNCPTIFECRNTILLKKKFLFTSKKFQYLIFHLPYDERRNEKSPIFISRRWNIIFYRFWGNFSPQIIRFVKSFLISKNYSSATTMKWFPNDFNLRASLFFSYFIFIHLYIYHNCWVLFPRTTPSLSFRQGTPLTDWGGDIVMIRQSTLG